MRIATWNINGLRARLDFILIWLQVKVTEGLIFGHPSFYGQVKQHPVDHLNRTNSELANF